jgi:anti-anti-sigma factor
MQNPAAVPIDGTDIMRIVVGENRLDVYNAPALRELTVQLVSELHYKQILDLDGVCDADSSGLGVTYGADKRALSHGGKLVLVNVGEKLANTLRITGLTKRLIVAPDLESAIAFFNPPQTGDEDDTEPQPTSGDHGTCTRCGGEIWYWEATAWNGVEEEVLDSGWSHCSHPADGHDAELGGPA